MIESIKPISSPNYMDVKDQASKQLLRSTVTIISPNFNKEDCIGEGIESVLKQTYQDWKLILVDDHSTDRSFEIASDIAKSDSRIHVFKNPKPGSGANGARNFGLEIANSDYVVFLDSDDFILPFCLARRVADMKSNPNLDFIAYYTKLFYNTPGDSDLLFNIKTNENELDRFLARDIAWQTAGPIWKREAVVSINGFDPALPSQQDVDLHIRALAKGMAYEFKDSEPDSLYRQNVESIPRRDSQTIAHFNARVEMIWRHHDAMKAGGSFNETRKKLLARYVLDIAQMMRWHQKDIGKEALAKALMMWKKASDRDLIGLSTYFWGVRYIRFKHNMLFNRVRPIQNRLQAFFESKLQGYIHFPSSTQFKLKYDEQKG